MAGASSRYRFATNSRLAGYEDDLGGPGVLSPRPRLACWYTACITSGMLNMLTAPALTLVFLGVVVSLGTAVVWILWEFEQAASKSIAKPHRNGDHFG